MHEEDEAERAALARAAAERQRTAEYNRAQSARSVPGAPNASEIATAMATASAQYSGGTKTATPGELAFASPFGGIQHYIRQDVDSARCARKQPGVYSCDYYMTWSLIGDEDSFLGKLAQAFSTTQRTSWSATFRKSGTGWTSADLDSSFRAAASRRASQQSASPSSSSDWASQQAKDYEYRQNQMNYVNDVLTYRPYSVP